MHACSKTGQKEKPPISKANRTLKVPESQGQRHDRDLGPIPDQEAGQGRDLARFLKFMDILTDTDQVQG